MNILVACDSFKEALSAEKVCQALSDGLILASEKHRVSLFPLADGGEGTARILTWHTAGKTVDILVNDPLFRPIAATYGISGDGSTAFIEMAAASGLQLLSEHEKNPMNTSSFGTGEMIADAIRRGVKKILLGIGGSATNDAGIGMARALGWKFLDIFQSELTGTGADLMRVQTIIPGEVFLPEIEILCDVDNPLYGDKGAAFIYGPQKGATPDQIKQLDQGLRHFARWWEKKGENHSITPGAGAAGGLGFGGKVFLNGKIRPGIEAVMDVTRFESALKKSNMVISGEGKIDGQTIHGKLISGICRKAQIHHVPVIAVCGALDITPQQLATLNLFAAFSIQQKPVSLAEAIASTARNLEQTGFNIGRLLAGFPQ
ncbi:MAG: glycerate kinase [Bacteroidia bacterium]|nr:glycerate kinase [Bacteroidia bacterium]